MTQPAQQPEYLMIKSSEFTELANVHTEGISPARIFEISIAVNDRSRPAPSPRPNLHTCVHKGIRNEVEFCHYYDSPTDPATIRNAALTKLLEDVCKRCPIRDEEMLSESYCAESCEGCLTRNMVEESLRTNQEQP